MRTQLDDFWISYRKLKTDERTLECHKQYNYVISNNNAYENGHKCVVSFAIIWTKFTYLDTSSGADSFYATASEQIRIYFGRVGVNTLSARVEAYIFCTRFRILFVLQYKSFYCQKAKTYFSFF